MDWIYNIYNKMFVCFSVTPRELLDLISIEELYNMNDINEPIEMTELNETCESDDKQILLVKLKGEMEYYVSHGDENFFECSLENGMLNDFLINWVDDTIPKYSLYYELSKLAEKRGKEHSPEWFIDHLSSVRFHYIRNKLVPFRYTVKK